MLPIMHCTHSDTSPLHTCTSTAPHIHPRHRSLSRTRSHATQRIRPATRVPNGTNCSNSSKLIPIISQLSQQQHQHRTASPATSTHTRTSSTHSTSLAQHCTSCTLPAHSPERSG